MTSFFNQLKGLVLLTILLLSFSKTNAQTENSGIIVRVNIDGTPTDYYPGLCGYGTANWGGAFSDDVLCGVPAWGYDITPDSLGCDSIPAGQLAGKIGMIRRGVCSFSAKAYNAQQAGAVAVLIAQIENAPTTDDCFVQAMGSTTPFSTNTTVPVLFMCRKMTNQIDAALKAAQNVQICFVRPEVDIVSVFYPFSHTQTPLSQIKTDTFGFGVNISNLSQTESRNNVNILAQVLKADGTELYSTELDIPELTPGVTDSFFQVPGLFVPDLPLGTYEVRYTSSSDVGANAPVKDIVGGQFLVTPSLYANDNGATIGYRPGTVGDQWAVGAVYQIVPGTIEKYQCGSFEFTFTTNATDYPVADVTSSLHLFRVNDDVDAGYNNFDDAEFFSSSLEWLGYAAYEAPANATAFGMQTATIDDVVAGSGPVKLDAGARYFAVAEYTAPQNLTFHGYDQKTDLPGVTSIVFNGTWFLGGFGAGNETVLRMPLTLQSKTDEQALPSNAMQIVPNPVVDQLNLAIQFEKATDATVTIADLNGRVITYQNYQGMINETLHFPLSVAAGTYLARIATKDGSLTKEFVVVK